MFPKMLSLTSVRRRCRKYFRQLFEMRIAQRPQEEESFRLEAVFRDYRGVSGRLCRCLCASLQVFVDRLSMFDHCQTKELFAALLMVAIGCLFRRSGHVTTVTDVMSRGTTHLITVQWCSAENLVEPGDPVSQGKPAMFCWD